MKQKINNIEQKVTESSKKVAMDVRSHFKKDKWDLDFQFYYSEVIQNLLDGKDPYVIIGREILNKNKGVKLVYIKKSRTDKTEDSGFYLVDKKRKQTKNDLMFMDLTDYILGKVTKSQTRSKFITKISSNKK